MARIAARHTRSLIKPAGVHFTTSSRESVPGNPRRREEQLSFRETAHAESLSPPPRALAASFHVRRRKKFRDCSLFSTKGRGSWTYAPRKWRGRNEGKFPDFRLPSTTPPTRRFPESVRRTCHVSIEYGNVLGILNHTLPYIQKYGISRAVRDVYLLFFFLLLFFFNI